MITIPRRHIEFMAEYGAFEPVSVNLKVATLDSESMIALCLRQGDAKVNWNPETCDDIAISGFPRKLFTEDTLASMFWPFMLLDLDANSNISTIEKNFRGLVSRVDDPSVDSKISIVNQQLSQLWPRDSDFTSGLAGPTVS